MLLSSFLSWGPSLSGWPRGDFQVVTGVEIGAGPHWGPQGLADVLLLEPVLKVSVGFRSEPQLDVIAKLTGLAEIQMVVVGEAEDWWAGKTEPSKETSYSSLSVDQSVGIVGCDGPNGKRECRCRCQSNKRHDDE